MAGKATDDEFTLDAWLRRRVVLDTQGPLIYIGRLQKFDAQGYWLSEADVHDRNDGHSTKEVYLSQARALEKSGTHNVNRQTVFVVRHEVVSISPLDDVVAADKPFGVQDWSE